jgi:hypothetical protein
MSLDEVDATKRNGAIMKGHKTVRQQQVTPGFPAIIEWTAMSHHYRVARYVISSTPFIK